MNEIDSTELSRVKQQFYARGEGIAQWATANGFSAAMVYSVLSGRSKARRGQAHLIAVALGIKDRGELRCLDNAASPAP